jgi:hypothetical protein
VLPRHHPRVVQRKTVDGDDVEDEETAGEQTVRGAGCGMRDARSMYDTGVLKSRNGRQPTAMELTQPWLGVQELLTISDGLAKVPSSRGTACS